MGATTRTVPTFIAATIISMTVFAACGDSTGPDSGGSSETVQITAYDCLEGGVNTSPFTVSEALALNTPDHGDASDYTWSETDVVTITLDGDTIVVDGEGAAAVGSTVTISSGGTYAISGVLDDGQIVVKGDGTPVVRLVLDGMRIANSGDAAIVISKVERAIIVLADGTTNTVTDGSTYPDEVDQNAAFFSKANLSIGGDGALVVTGRFNDGLTSKDGLVIDGGNISVAAVDDGIRGKDYLVIRGGSIEVESGGDGLKSDEDEDSALGYILVEGGSVEVTSGGDGLQAETDALISDGLLVLRAGGGHAATIDTSLSAKGVKGLASVVIDGGELTIDAADDGLHSNDLVVINGGTITIATGDDGVHADSALTVNGGDVTVTASYEGIENKEGNMTLNGGRIHVVSSDDGINVAGAGDEGRPGPGTSSAIYHLYVNGGYIVSDATGDGVDVNGSIVMSGGCLLVHGPTVDFDGALDFDGSFQMTGGLLVAAGSAGMAQGPGTSSSQAVALLLFGTSEAAGTIINIQSADGEGLLAFAPERAYESLAFSSPDLSAGQTYSVYLGGTATGTLTDGLYEGGTYTPGSYVGSFTASGGS